MPPSIMAARRMTAPFGGPVVPEVKITTPGALGSSHLFEEILTSSRGIGCSLSMALMGRKTKSGFVVF